MLTAAIRQHTREQCAAAALSRLASPPLTLVGLDETDVRRERCLQAALLRYVQPAAESAALQRKAVKRTFGQEHDAQLVHEAMCGFAGNDRFSPLLCGTGHSCKRQCLSLVQAPTAWAWS